MEDGGQQWTSQVLIGDDCKLSDCLDTTEILYLGHQHPAVHCSTSLLEKVEYQPAQSHNVFVLLLFILFQVAAAGVVAGIRLVFVSNQSLSLSQPSAHTAHPPHPA